MTSLAALLWAYCFPAIPGPPAVTCAWQPASTPSEQTCFTLALRQDNQEIENQYLSNNAVYTRVVQYLNNDIAQDVFLTIPGLPDSVAATTASYPRQYGTTGRSSVLLVFPVPEKALRHGCHVTFRGNKLELGTQRFFFTAADIKAARRGQPAIK